LFANKRAIHTKKNGLARKKFVRFDFKLQAIINFHKICVQKKRSSVRINNRNEEETTKPKVNNKKIKINLTDMSMVETENRRQERTFTNWPQNNI
jgi:hypothetical protein